MDTYYASYKGGGTFESRGLNCNAAPSAQTVGLMHKDSSCCHVSIYNDNGGDAVFYICARFPDGTPKEIEALCAVSTADNGGAFGNATYVKVGDKITLNYPHREYDSSYHVFDWSVVEGKDNVSIDGVGSTCTVTALKPGVAAVKLVYSYSVEEPDVLLGTPPAGGPHQDGDVLLCNRMTKIRKTSPRLRVRFAFCAVMWYNSHI